MLYGERLLVVYTSSIMIKVARYVTLGALFIIPFLSLYVSNSVFFPFITGKNFAFRILVEIAFAGWIVLMFADIQYRPKFSWTALWFKLLVLWMFIANLYAINPHKAFWSNFERMDGFVTIAHLYIFFIVMGSVLTPLRLWRKWWLTFIGGASLVVLYGLGQLAGLFSIHQGTTRVDATLGNAEYLAGYMLFAIGVTLWQAFQTKGKTTLRWALFILSFLEFVILYTTQTRGAFVAIVGAAFFGVCMWMFQAGAQERKYAVATLIGLIFLVGGFISIRDSAFVQNNQALSRISAISLKELATRFTIWNMAIEGIKEKPLLGWGQEGFNYIFAKHYSPSMYAQEPWFDRAHDVYLDFAVAGGIPAVVLFIALLMSAFWTYYKAQISQTEIIVLLSVLVAYAIQGLVVFDNLFTYIPLVGLFALAHGYSGRPIKILESYGTVTKETLQFIVTPFVCVLLAGSLWVVNIKNLGSAADLIKGLTPTSDVTTRLNGFKSAIQSGSFATQEIREQLIQFTQEVTSAKEIPDTIKQEVAQYTIDQVGEEIKRAPNDPRLRLQFAVLYRVLGSYKDARAQSAVARSLSPKKQSIIFEQGIEAWQAGDTKDAKKLFNEAYDLDKSFPDAAVYAAAGYVLTGDTQGAKKLLLERFGTTAVTQGNTILILAYYQIKDWANIIPLMEARYGEIKDSTTGFQLVSVYAESGRKEDAKRLTQEIIQKYPEAASQGAAILKQLGG
jgi:O-antigen ligase/lipoprotein NlpI